VNADMGKVRHKLRTAKPKPFGNQAVCGEEFWHTLMIKWPGVNCKRCRRRRPAARRMR